MAIDDDVRVDPYPAMAAFLVERYDRELVKLRQRLRRAKNDVVRAALHRRIRARSGQRRVVLVWESWLDGYTGDDFNPYFLAQQTLRQLASEYADHPDFREEWRP